MDILYDWQGICARVEKREIWQENQELKLEKTGLTHLDKDDVEYPS